ncbi:NRDE family protein [Rhodoferax sp.]|uniref:NRDE family protein n=1 Tax=Rhodoferax sp. TaxID=50421 RepID=UPI00272EE889|nr:NRDE family protein [Rhodoferax sp.]MDP1529628.1 NRDE family protein [Rhodoferax sp.]MDP1945394.1 NRDE family protein [Rhodoferax sp.]MDP2441477.1 NRDE family protein [Rhodoferax sp.]MDZ4207339.1 NRDE family protein [Rhodoferax sp.]
MCLIAWNWQPDNPAPLLLIANRDEFYARPTAPLDWWQDAPILAGRDLQAGGTWLGVSHSGRLAALTNHRAPESQRADAPSRGALVSGFLQSEVSAEDYLGELAGHAADYNPFNLLVFDGTRLMGLESRHAKVMPIQPGIGAVSNADFLTPWPKLTRLSGDLQTLLAQAHPSDAELLALLHNPVPALDADLPVTGIPMALERALSAAFVALPDYGTRACSVVRFEAGEIAFLEQSFDADGSIGTRQVTTTFQCTLSRQTTLR